MSTATSRGPVAALRLQHSRRLVNWRKNHSSMFALSSEKEPRTWIMGNLSAASGL